MFASINLFRVAVAVALLFSSTAYAQLFRAYLAINGNDGNPCTLQSPCRLLPAALSAVANGGEIWLLDSANYNTTTVTITKSVTILAVPGALGSVVGTGGDAIEINAPSAAVKLRNVNVRPLSGSGSGNGINVSTVGQLFLDQVVIESMGVGLFLTGPAAIAIKDSTVRSNSTGMYVSQTGGATQYVSIDRTSFIENSGQAIAVWTNSTSGIHRLTIDESVITGPGLSNGALAFGGGVSGAAPVRVSITRTKIAGKGSGIGLSSFGAQTSVALASCHVAGWSTGATLLNGLSGVGVIQSLGNNLFVNNQTNSTFAPSPLAPI
jgi:hypothetical protein